MAPTIDWLKTQKIREARTYNGDIYVSLEQDEEACNDIIYKIDKTRKSISPVNQILYKFGTTGTNGIYKKSKPIDTNKLKDFLYRY